MKYEPNNFDSFKELVAHAYSLGMYHGRKNIFDLKCEGQFEGFSRRATETWEVRFIVTSDEILFENGRVIPSINVYGSSVKEVCDKALELLKNAK